jgi:lambda repressor-like predicted transcriptional regulator
MDGCAVEGCPAAVKSRGRCESHYRKFLRMGRCGYQEVEELRGKVAALRNLGWTWEAIARPAGLSHHTARLIHLGQTRNVWPETAAALLALPVVPYDSHRGIDSAGTRRRVQALSWMGWPCSEVAARAGVSENTLRTVIQPSRRISFTLARKITAVYDELSMVQGPSKGAAGKARGRGHLPPLAWEDDLIDLPEPDLAQELARRVSVMDDAEVRACYQAKRLGDPSVLIAAGATEFHRRRHARVKAARQVAA